MAAITATAMPIQGYVLISISFAGDDTVTYGGAVRIEADGTTTPVRVNTAPDATGEFMLLSGGMATLYDTEAPLDVALTYQAVEPSGVYTATSPEVVLPSSQTLWLRDPLYPANSVRLFLTPPNGLPECKPGEGLFWRTKNGETFASQTTNTTINNSPLPIPAVRKRLAASSVLSIISRTFIDRGLLEILLSNGTILLLDTPPQYGVSRRYVSLGDYTASPASRVGSRQWDLVEAPYQIVGRPAGGSFGVAGTRWDDLCGKYATFGDATSASVTWLGVTYGMAGDPAALATFRTWAQVKSEFATWSAVNTGGRTWGRLLAGS